MTGIQINCNTFFKLIYLLYTDILQNQYNNCYCTYINSLGQTGKLKIQHHEQMQNLNRGSPRN